MCGICGVWNYATNAPVDRALIQRMSDAMSHRGPDDSGIYFDDANGLGMGFRRLSIIDLASTGHQPMCNEDGTVWIVFNGEIYNFLDLRSTLCSKGHVFRSRTDTEVIIHQYEERGVDAVSDLNGMFGFAVWDAGARRLTLARDRVGKKPLYYYDDGQRVLFASELKSILIDRSVSRQLDYAGLSAYLALGYVASPHSIIQRICKVPPAHILTFENGTARLDRYWDWLPAFTAGRVRSEQDWMDELRALFKTVVRERLISDVPLGAFLSGGVDSSAVVAAMAELSDHPVKTFSIGFKHEPFNELDYARRVAEHFGTEHHEYIVEPELLRNLLPRLVNHLDEPFADSSALPTYYVAKAARECVTVCLSGDGGDETWAGYTRYAQFLRESWADCLPFAMRQSVFTPLSKLIPPGIKGQQLVYRMSLGFNGRYSEGMRLISIRQLMGLLTPDAIEQIDQNGVACVSQALARGAGLDSVSRMQYTDGATYLSEDILVKVDRMSMANSLEVRCPLLDYRFMELAANVPSELRLRNGKGKYLFKRALRGLVPDEALDRPKMGFGVPLREWFRDELTGYAAEVLLDRQTMQRGLWQTEKVQDLLAKHRSGVFAFEPVIWAMLVHELWARTYLD